MPTYVKILEEGEGAEDEVLGVIWNCFWQWAHQRDRRSSIVSAPTQGADGKLVLSIDPGTGLPVSANDLRSAAEADDGIDIMFTQIVAPKQLALACTYWWKDNWEGDRVQVLAYTPKAQRTPEMIYAYKENVRKIKRKAHELAGQGLINVRPINPNDTEMHDLVWEDADCMTIGFAITWEGWEACREWIGEHAAVWDRKPGEGAPDILDVASDEVRANAPQWKKDERGKPSINVSSGGFKASSGGTLKF